MQSNTTFTDKHLASLAAIMLLAPAVNFMLKEKSIDITTDEESYVRSYIRYGYYILMTLGLALLVWGAYSFFFPLSILYRTNYALLGGVILMIIIGVFSIVNNKTIIDRETHNNNTETNPAILIYFIPLYNYYLWYNESLDAHNYRWVKESILWRSLYLIVISIRPNAATVFIGLFIIVARCIMVTVGMDILSSHAKYNINKWFYRNIEEFIAYPLALIFHPLKKLFTKGSTLHNEVDSWKLTYSHLDKVSHPRTILSYIITLGAIGYWGYMTWLTSGPTVGMSLALLPQILWIGKILMTIPSGSLPRIPVIYTLLGGRKEISVPPVSSDINNTNNSVQHI